MISKILRGMRQAATYARGESDPSKVHEVEVDVRAVRKKLGLSQAEFALRFGFTLSSIQNWEQGYRQPQGPARVLLRVIEREPAAVQRALSIF
jgi:putative transcriptional regulator